VIWCEVAVPQKICIYTVCTAPLQKSLLKFDQRHTVSCENGTRRGTVTLHGAVPWSGTKILFGPCLWIWCRLDPAFYRQAYEAQHNKSPTRSRW